QQPCLQIFVVERFAEPLVHHRSVLRSRLRVDRVLVSKRCGEARTVESCRASDALERRARQARRPELTLHAPERFAHVELSWTPASGGLFCAVLHQTTGLAIV